MIEDVGIKELEFIINQFLKGNTLKNMITGINYYKGYHDILNRVRYGIGKDGERVVLNNVPNNKIVDNQFKNIVDQKVNYLLGKPMSLSTENTIYNKELLDVFNSNFMSLIKSLGKNDYLYGISWLYVYYDNTGKLGFKIFDSKEIIPVWQDNEHTILDYCIRVYNTKIFDGKEYKINTNVELYTINGVSYYELKNNKLYSVGTQKAYINLNGFEYNWEKLPLIPFKLNEFEMPLIINCKNIQEAIKNIDKTKLKNDLSENNRNTILVLKNYSGQGSDFRKNLNQYGYIAVQNDGGVESLKIEVNSSNYESILKILKKAMYENSKGIDVKNDTLGSNPNQMNIQSMYSDIDLDANELETNFKKSLLELLWFINQHLLLTKKGDFTKEKVEFIFNRDILINESQAIDDCIKSNSILSERTILAQHPWVADVDLELKYKNQESIYNEDVIDE